MLNAPPLAATAFPVLRPGMVMPRKEAQLPFPLDGANTKYYYMGRNGLYALARAWKLQGKEVLMPAYCHGVEAQAFECAGAKLRFFPVHERMRVDENELFSYVTPQTRVIHLIHYLGFASPVQRIAAFCSENHIRLVEDCALAFLSRQDDRPLGTFGDAANFSLYKTLPLPNGGAVALNDGRTVLEESTRSPRLNSTVAYTASALFRHARLGNSGGLQRAIGAVKNALKPGLHSMGLERVATDIFEISQAALGMSAISRRIMQSQDFDRIFEKRRRNFEHLLARLNGKTELVFHELPEGVCPLAFPIAVNKKLEVVGRLVARGVEATTFWLNHANGVNHGDFPEVDRLRGTVIELPCHQDLTSSDVDRVADEVISVLATTY